MDERLTNYAVKHAIYHLTDAGIKQADNVARVLCSLHYVQLKLKLMTPGIPVSVAVRYLIDDYEHSHWQVSFAPAADPNSRYRHR